MSDDVGRPAGPRERARSPDILQKPWRFSDHVSEVQQRGVPATAQIMTHLIAGLGLPRGTILTVVDLLPNRFWLTMMFLRVNAGESSLRFLPPEVQRTWQGFVHTPAARAEGTWVPGGAVALPGLSFGERRHLPGGGREAPADPRASASGASPSLDKWDGFLEMPSCCHFVDVRITGTSAPKRGRRTGPWQRNPRRCLLWKCWHCTMATWCCWAN